MATMPIEIIVQDAEAPIVQGEDGTNNTETNITVPDTGTINSNGGTSSSASSIILPAILLVLAIGSIVAILIYKYHKQKKDKISKKEKLAVAASSTMAVLAATVLASNLILPATKAVTSDATDGITPAEDKVSIIVTRDGGSVEESIESIATITSTSDFGYKVLLSMAEGVETASLYLDGDEASEYYIAATEGAELSDNTWGFALTEDGEYSAMPLLDDAMVVAQGDEPVEDEGISVYYGVKVSSDLPVGTYSGGETEYSLEAKEPTLPISYMQDFATLSEEEKTTLISSMPEGYQFTLKDSRDKKDYFISKLKDGNVWMTQNLDLDIEMKAEGSIVYDSTNTDLLTNTTWEPERATIPKDDLSSDTWRIDGANPYSYDPGDIYYYTSGSGAGDTKYESLEACAETNHTEAECRHYHAGNYYNWAAILASNDSSELAQQYPNFATSICPAGWKLPVSDTLATYNVGDFYRLLNESGGILGNETPSYMMAGFDYTTGGFFNIRTNPLWLVRSGEIAKHGDIELSNAGWSGFYRSSASGKSGLSFDREGVFPNYQIINAGSGVSARCIVR